MTQPFYWTRFIPTCVGNTRSVLSTVPTCGTPKPVIGIGSSPRAWGTHQCRSAVCVLPASRFIPTCVGNTKLRSLPFRRQPFGSSPRAWGTRMTRRAEVPASIGSSPRAWGTQRPFEAAHLSPCSPVHPHVRGEHDARLRCSGQHHAFSGSSPRAWGTRRMRLPLQMRLPTGSSPRAWGTPHQSHMYASLRRCFGSSPRAWGTRPFGLAAHSPGARFIPTCVGNTPSSSRDPWSVNALRFIPTCVGNTRYTGS